MSLTGVHPPPSGILKRDDDVDCRSPHNGAKSHNLQLARGGEDLACQLLVEKGCRILHRNWRAGRFAELDIIADDGNGILIFAEVKTRLVEESDEDSKNIGFWSVHGLKQNKIINAALRFLNHYNLTLEQVACRFDVIVVNVPRRKGDENSEIEITHVKDAFHRLSWSLD